MFDNVPRHVKLMFLIAILAIGPIIAIAAMLGGFNVAMFTVAVIFIAGMIAYLVTIRKYTEQQRGFDVTSANKRDASAGESNR